MVLTSNSKMLCKTDLPSVMLECPRTASHARRPQERNVTGSSALGARSVGERSKIQRRVRTKYSGAVEEGKTSAVPGRAVDYGSSESLLVVPNGPENRREWRSEESDCNDLYAWSGFGTGPEALNTHTMGTPMAAGIRNPTWIWISVILLYTVSSRKSIVLNGVHLGNLLSERTPLHIETMISM